MSTPPARLNELEVPAAVEREIDEVISHYPEKRSASLMVLHRLQEEYGHIGLPAMEWAAAKLDLQPIHLYELVSFYPMFRQEPGAKFTFKVCRTLSCALSGAYEIHRGLCEKLGMDPQCHELQSTEDGRFAVEFVECLASCHTAPVVMRDEKFYENVTRDRLEQLVAECEEESATASSTGKEE